MGGRGALALPTFAGRQVGIEKPERVGRLDDPNAFPALRLSNLLMELFHLGPVQLRPEMVFGVVAVVEPKQVVPFVVRTDAPGDRLVRVAPVMKEITVQVGAAVPEVIEGQEVEPEFPV